MPGAWILACASIILGPPPEITEPAEDVPGIEFAPAPTLDPDALPIEIPPPPEGEEEGPVGLTPAAEAELWPDPGTAPPDGAAAFVSAGVLIAVGVLVPLGLLQDRTLSVDDRVAIIVAGAGMEVIAVAGLGLGISRRMKLVRWAGAYRVVPTPQGGGLLALGGIAATAGLTLVPLGIWVMARGGSVSVGTAMLLGGTAALGVVAPPAIVFGKRRRDAYLAGGGWIRRPLPPVTLTPRVLVLPAGFGLSLTGRF